MNTAKSILQKLASFEQMERGTLSVIRESSSGPCCNFQRWEDGQHRSEYIPADQVAVVEANLARHHEFQSQVDQYVALVSQESRENRLAGGKKKRPTPTFASPKKRKSKT